MPRGGSDYDKPSLKPRPPITTGGPTTPDVAIPTVTPNIHPALPGTNAGEGEQLNKDQLPGGTGQKQVGLARPVKPDVSVPTITPPSLADQTDKGMLKGVGDVTAKTVDSATPITAATAKAGKVDAKTAQAKQAGAATEVQAADYKASQVDPMAAQVEAATTDYKAKVQAAQGQTPQEALVSHQMEELTRGLESGNIPMWAQGAVAAVDAQLAARGLSRSSIGSADLTQAIMAAALPIAQQNAQTEQANFSQNLQNKQRANELQAQLQTNVELANLSNEQQARLANQASQQAIMLSNQSAQNASKQFNAQSENQVNTFMANLRSQTEQFNTAQANAMTQFNTAQVNAANTANAQLATQTGQFNAAQTNAMAQFNQTLATDLKKFNANQTQQADIFNKQNAMVIAQSNAQWRRQIAQADTQMQHEANMQTASNRFNLSMAELNNYWQVSRDFASWAWQSAENALSRQTQLVLNSQNNKAAKDAAKAQADAARESGWADAIGTITGAVVSGLFGKD